MKKIFLLTALLGAFSTHAQKFTSADDALFYLEDVFVSTTTIKEGEYWINPIMLQFEEDAAIYLHMAKGKILEKDYVSNNEIEMGKLEVNGIAYLDIIFWKNIKNITVAQNSKKEWWLSIEAPVYDADYKLLRNSTALYLVNGHEAERIKSALNYLRKK